MRSLQDRQRIDASARLRLVGFVLFVAIYFLSFLQRVAVSVVADNLVLELGLDSVALGFMSSGFFISYAVLQPALGFLSDKLGPERVSAVAVFVAAIGSFLFAGARGFTSAFLGRIIMGAGLAAGFIPGRKFIALNFPPQVFSTYNSLFIAIGNIGALMGAAPLAWLATAAGWRQVFTGLAVVALLLAGLCWIFATKQPIPEQQDQDMDSYDKPSSYLDVIMNRNLQLLSFFLFARYGTQMAFQALWGVPYISGVYEVSPTSAAAVITMIATGYVIGAPVVGRLADVLAARGMDAFTARWNILLGTAVCYFLTWVPIALDPGFLSFRAMYVLLFIMGAAASSAGLVYSIAKDLFPPGVSGFATGLVNVMSIMGGAVMPPLVGWFIRLFTARGLEGGGLYSNALVPCLVFAALGVGFILMVRKPVEESSGSGIKRSEN